MKPAKNETFTWLPVQPPKSQAMEMSRQNAAHAIPNVATIVAPHVLALASVLTARPVTYERGWPPRYLRAMPYFITIAVPAGTPSVPMEPALLGPVTVTAADVALLRSMISMVSSTACATTFGTMLGVPLGKMSAAISV